jgi:ABC-type Fe3+ transport system permease subunit
VWLAILVALVAVAIGVAFIRLLMRLDRFERF